MRQIELDIIVKDAQARTSAKELQRMYSEISRDASGNITQIVDKYSNALGNLETHILKVGRNGDTYIQKQVSDISKATAIIEKQGVAWQNAYSKSEQLLSSFEKISKETSVFGKLSENAFSSYSKGILTAKEAVETTNNTIQYSSQFWQDYYNSIVGVGKQCGVTREEVSVFGELSDSAFEKYSTGAMSANDANKELEKQTPKTTEKVDALGNALKRLSQLLVSQVSRAFKDAISEMKAVDSELIVIKKVTDASAEDLEKLKDRAYETAKQYGVTASDYLSSVAEFSRAGYKEQAADLAELAVKLQLVGDVSQDVANQFLIATDKSYKFNGNTEKLSETIDKANEIDNKYATTIEKIASGMGIIAPVAAQMNTSLDETMAAVGTITAVTQRSGTEAARALRAIMLNIVGDTKTEIEDGATWTAGEIVGLRDLLREYAPQIVEEADKMGKVIDPMKAIGALAQAYKDGLLTEQELTERVSDIGGKLRTSQLLALIQNWDSTYVKMLDDIKDATGSADKEVENFLSGWEARLNILKTTWTDFVQKTISSDFIKSAISGLTLLLDSLDNLGNAIAIIVPSIVALKAQDLVKWFNDGKQAVQSFAKAFIGVGEASDIVAARMAAVAISIVTTLVIINKIRDAQEKQLKTSIELATASHDESVELAQLYVAYTTAKDGSDEMLEASKKLKEALDDEAISVKNLKDAYKEKSSESLSSATQDAKAAYDLAQRDFNWLHSVDSIGIHASFFAGQSRLQFDTYDKLAKDYSEELAKLIVGENGKRGIANLQLNGATAERIYDDTVKALELMRQGGYADISKFGSKYNALLDIKDALEAPVQTLKETKKAYYDAKAAEEAFNAITKDGIDTQEEVNEWLSKNANTGLSVYNDALRNAFETYFPEFTQGSDEVTVSLKEQAVAALGLADDLSNATFALEKYKQALSGGEKGDTFKSIAEAYNSAIEMLDKGLTGTNQYIAAIDLLIPQDVLRTLKYNYEEAGKLLRTDFYKALFAYDGEDFGANAAMYFKDNKDAFSQFYDVTEESDGSFKIAINDIKGLSEALSVSEETLWALMDSWDAFNSATNISIADLKLLKDQFTDTNTGAINFVDLISELVSQGKTESQIRNIVQGIAQMEDVDISELPKNLSDTIQDIKELKSKADALGEGFTLEVSTDPTDVTTVLNPLKKEMETISGTPVIVSVVYRGEGNSGYYPSDFIGPLPQHNWRGVTNATAGWSFVNEKGAELIKSGDSAYIANDGKLSLVRLHQGDTVYNANETSRLVSQAVSTDDFTTTTKTTDSGNGTTGSFNNNFLQAFLDALKGDKPDNSKSGGGGGKKSSTKTVADSDLLSMLSDYIKDLLDKAKKALDAQIDAIDAQIDALKKQHDAEEEANELEELRLKILEAEKNLVDANVERTVRYFNKATGQWEWMADQKAVAQAQKALEDAQQAYYDKLAEMEYQAKLDELQAQKDALKENYNALSDNWNDIKDEISKALNKKDVLSLAEILTKLGLTAASGSVGGVNSLIADINAFTGSFDNGGFAFGKGFLLKGVSKGETVLDESITDRILSPKSNSQFTNFTNSLTKLFGMSSGDVGAKAQSLINSIDRSSNISGDTYYINGVRIGSDMMDRPLSEILSVLPIYAS